MSKNVKMRTTLINFFFQENDIYYFLISCHKDIFILFYRSVIYISSSFLLRYIYIYIFIAIFPLEFLTKLIIFKIEILDILNLILMN
jgi:hypothetical protein